MRPKLGKFRPLNSKSDRIAHVSNNWKHRSSTSGWTLTIAFGFTAIDDDTANARGLQAFPRPLLIRHFLRASHSVHVSFSYFGGAAFLLLCEAAAQSTAAACRAGIARWRGAALDNRPSWRRPGEYTPLACCERRIQFLSDPLGVLTVQSSLPQFHTIILVVQDGTQFADFFRHVTSRQFWSGCISLHQASRISRPLDATSTICQCGHSSSFLIQFRQGATARRLGLFYEKIKQETPLDWIGFCHWVFLRILSESRDIPDNYRSSLNFHEVCTHFRQNETFENFAISFHVFFFPCRQFGLDVARFTWHSSRISAPPSGRSVQRREVTCDPREGLCLRETIFFAINFLWFLVGSSSAVSKPHSAN